MANAIPTLSSSAEKVCFVVVKAREFDAKDVLGRRIQSDRRPHDRGAGGSTR